MGSLAGMRDDYLGTLALAAAEVGPVARIDAGPPLWRSTIYSISAPELVETIFGTPERFTKDDPGAREMRRVLGNGMLTSQGSDWRQQRRLLAPLFTSRRLSATYAPIMVEEAQRLVRRWLDAADAAVSVDADLELVALASRIVGRILFGSDMAQALPEIVAVTAVNLALLDRTVSPHPVPRWLPTPANRRLTRGIAGIRGVIDDLVQDRRVHPRPGGDDMLDLLLAARDDQRGGAPLSDTEVADQLVTFLLAGLDTTATTLACVLVELARAPHWQQVVHDEVASVLGGRTPTAADATELRWTNRASREAMRLYPASHSLGRTAVRDEIVGGYRIPAGATVVYAPWAVHRSPQVWPDPDNFDPGRFDLPAGQVPGGHRYAWMPFGAGPHACIGLQVAMLETTLVPAIIVQQLELSTTLTAIGVEAAITLKPVGPLPLQLRRR